MAQGNIGRGAKHGATGATLGSYFGPAGAVIGGGLGLGYGLLSDDGSGAQDATQAAFDANVGELGALSNNMDDRRKAALRQSLAMFGPVDGVISKMYGPGAVGPDIDIDALFGPGGPVETYNPMTPQRRELQRGTGSYWDPARDELANERRRTVDRNLERSELNKNGTFNRGTKIRR